MPASWYERLSVQDSSFLTFESPHAHMHVGGVALLEAAPLAAPGGGIDIDRIRAYITSRLEWIPRYRQRIAYTPIENHPIWVDDKHFSINYHVRHACLPHPGDERQLKRLAARIMSQQLDQGKPLWEAWFIEGLEGNRFAFLSKAHHCMVDGIASVDLISVLMSPTAETAIPETAPWVPRRAPSTTELLRDETIRRLALPWRAVQGLRRGLQEPERFQADLQDQLSAAMQTIAAGMHGPAKTPLNKPIGPHRRFDWLTLNLAEVKEVKNRLGGTVNDVVLATAAGGIRRFLERRRVNVDDLDYRVVLPVSTRPPEEHGKTGNQVSAWLTSLPVQEHNPALCLARVRDNTKRLKVSKQALGAQTLTQVGEWVGTGLMTLGVRLAARLHPYNLIITNVPGPQAPLYLLGARMLVGYPEVPLFENQGLGIALLSYDGKLCWGFNADWDMVPDLHNLIDDVSSSFRDLQNVAAGLVLRDTAPKKGPRRARRPSAAPRRATAER